MTPRTRFLAASLTLAVLAAGTLVVAQTPATAPATTALAPAAPAALRATTERVVIFKDGYGLVIKNLTGTADAAGRLYTTQVPDSAVLGCFWALGEKDKLVGMRAEWDDTRQVRKITTPALSVRELLRANAGRRVTLTLAAEKERTNVTGIIAELLETPVDPKRAPVGQPWGGPPLGLAIELTAARSPFDDLRALSSSGYSLGAAAPLAAGDGGTIIRELTPKGGDYVVLDEDGNRRVLPIADIKSVTGKDLATAVTREEEVHTRAKRLAFDFGKDSAGKPVALKLFYFASGIRWIPTYRISGKLTDSADVALQGEILNELEDISGAAVDLVVGVPNFRFKDTPSPITLERTMRNALAAAAPGLSNRGDYANQMLNTQYFSNASHVDWQRPAPAAPIAPELAGNGGEQDLYPYPLKDFELKKSARATVPLWQASVPLRHLYTYDLKARRSRSTGGWIKGAEQADTRSPAQITLNTIWHQLELTNNTSGPWTTGAALMIRENLPLGQDMLTYTSAGGSTLLPVTVAVDLRGSSDEEEVERRNNALKVDGYEYALVKKKGTITITNYRKDKSQMRVSFSTGGKVEEASDKGKIRLNDFRPDDWDDASYMRPNNHSDVTWEFSLDPGASKSLSYTTSSYVR